LNIFKGGDCEIPIKMSKTTNISHT